MKARVKNWSTFQHYSDRTPPWIKLHRDLLDDFKFHALPVASRALAPCIWLLASESLEGEVDVSPEFLAWRLRMTPSEAERAVMPLIEQGFLVVDSDALAERERGACPETETETETEKRRRWSFSGFWSAYPKKVGKGACESKWAKLCGDDRAAVMADLEVRTWPDKEFIPNPLTYLNQKRWLDEDKAPVKSNGGLPKDDAALESWATQHGLPGSRPGESYRDYRARLGSMV